MKTKFFSFISNLFTSGLYPKSKDIPLVSRFVLANFIVLVGFIALAPFSVIAYSQGNVTQAISNIAGIVIMLAVGTYLRRSKNIALAGILISTLVALMLLHALATGVVENTGIFWLYTFPLAAFFLLGRRAGLIAVVAFYLCILYILTSGTSLLSASYSYNTKLRFLSTFLVVAIVTFFYELVKTIAQEQLAKSEEEVRQSEKNFRKFVDELPQIVFDMDTKGNFLFVNNHALEAFKYTPDEFSKGMNVFQVFLPEERKKLQKNIGMRVRGEIPATNEYTAIRKDGTTFPVLIYSNPVLKDGEFSGLRGIVIDISLYKEARQALEWTEHRYRSLFDRSPIGIALFDSPGKLINANGAFIRIFGTNDEKAFQRYQLFNDPCIPQSIKDELLQGKPFSGEVEYEFSRPHNELGYVTQNTGARFLLYQITPMGKLSVSSTVTGYLTMVQDITSARRAREERQQLQDQLRQTEKMQAIGQLAGGIAHDFNNQVCAIAGFADLLKSNLGNNEKLQRYAETILKTASDASKLTSQLLAFSRRGKYLTAPVNLNKIISDIVDLLSHSIDKNIVIKKMIGPSPMVTIGDPSQIQNAFLNIAINARDAMPDGGELTISVEETPVKPQDLDINQEDAADEFVLVSIRDTGCGMSEETMKHIFEPYFTTKKVGRGTGMGLASAYGTIRNHKGSIRVDSEPDNGTCFNVFLPLAESPIPYVETPRAESPIKGQGLVLVVDDEIAVREMTTEMLNELGYKTLTFENGKAAIEFYKENWKKADLVILDMIMPELDGKETFINMKSINPEIKAIIASGYSINGKAQETLDLGAMSYIQKPFKMVELARQVSGYIEKGNKKSK